jgi:hypothetical protein
MAISKRRYLFQFELAGVKTFAVIVILLLLLVWGSEALQFQDHRMDDNVNKPGHYYADNYTPMWCRIASMPDRRMHHATVYSPCNDKIYVIGGSVDYFGLPNRPESNCWEYDPLADAWTIKCPMPMKLNFICGVYCDRKIYIIGGYDSTNTAIRNNLIYDIDRDYWYQGFAFPSPSTAAASRAVWRDSLIYCLGGVITEERSERTNEVYIYAPAVDTFYKASSLPFFMFYSGTTLCFNDNLYIFGGATWPYWPLDSIIIGTIQSSQPDSINWALFDTLPYPIYMNSVGLLEDKVYIVGGRILTPNPVETNKVWEYGLTTGQYYEMSDHPLPLICGIQFVAVKPDSHWLYTMGGDTVFVEPSPHSGEGTASCFRLEISNSHIAEHMDYEQVTMNSSIHAFPNPFKNSIEFRVWIASTGEKTSLKIHDVTGRVLRDFSRQRIEIDTRFSVLWDGKDETGMVLPPGVYFVHLETADQSVTKKIVKLK